MKKIKIILNEQQYNKIFLTEDRTDFLRSQYVGKQPKDVSKQQLIDDATFNKIIAADPSSNKQYSQWLLNLFFWKQLMLEDLYKATEYLQIFDKFKNKMPEKDINKKDVNGFFYNSLQKLFSVVKPFMGTPTESSMSDNTINKKIKNEETERVFENDEWLIVVPKTKRASCLYGKGTQWCTAADKSENRFNEYNKQGKLYINIHKPTNKKYQFHFETESFMDENDEETKILFQDNTLLTFYGKLGKLNSIVKLDLSGTGVSILPEFIGNLKDLKYLNLSSTQIEDIPKSIGNLKNLEKLDVSSTKITDLPEFISNLTNLKNLDLSFTKIAKIPIVIGNLINLTQLTLTHTPIQDLLENPIGKLSNLAILKLNGTQIRELPEFIGRLVNLQYLDLSYMKITKLPESIGSLKRLKNLELSGTPISKFPISVSDLSKLEILALKNGTQFSQQEIETIKTILPNVRIY